MTHKHLLHAVSLAFVAIFLVGLPSLEQAQGQAPVTAVRGSGTPGKIPKWTGTTLLGNSVIVESSGNVGIGTTPANRLSVSGDANFSGNVGIGTTAPGKQLTISRPGPAGQFGLGIDETASIVDGTFNGLVVTQFAAGGTPFGPPAELGSFKVMYHSTGHTDVSISTRLDPDALFIKDGGNVGIGTNDPTEKLDVAGDIRLGTGTTGCVKDADNTVIAGTCSSDARLKKNIKPFAAVLDKLSQLSPVHFQWKGEEYPERGLGSAMSFGLIAQEVEDVLPELVTEDGRGDKAVRYNKLPLMLLQAVKELKAENEALKSRIQELESKVETVRQ